MVVMVKIGFHHSLVNPTVMYNMVVQCSAPPPMQDSYVPIFSNTSYFSSPFSAMLANAILKDSSDHSPKRLLVIKAACCDSVYRLVVLRC